MFPENVVQATFQRVQTKYMLKYPIKPTNKMEFLNPAQPPLAHPPIITYVIPSNNTHTAYLRKKIEYVQGMNILGNWWIIVFKFLATCKGVINFD